MKIAMIIPALENKGPVIVAKDLCDYYIKHGHTCEVFYFDYKDGLKFNCEVTKINFWLKINLEKYDIIHSHCLRPNIYLWFHYRYDKRRTKFVTTLHQPLSFKTMRLSRSFCSSLILHCLDKISHQVFDANVLLSKAQYEISKDNIPHNSIHIIGNGRNIKVKDISENIDKLKILELKRKYKILGSVSVLIKRKGLEQLINSLTGMKDWAAVVVGDGPELQNLKHLAMTLGVYDRCYFCGYKIDGVNYIQYFDVYALPSRSEGFPLAFIEAAAFGKPVVLSNISILNAIASDDTAVFFELDNIDDFVQKVNYAYDNRCVISSKINLYYNKQLTVEVMAQNYIALYDKILAKSSDINNIF